jgi:phosphosulfolactate synthase (CoM biosynthesis protein A)
MTEIRGPYYTPLGAAQLGDILETMGEWVDTLKFAGGSFTLMPRRALRAIIEMCHRHRVLVSTGGFVERVLVQGPDAVRAYIAECKDVGFDIVELSSGFVTLAADDWLRLIDRVQKADLMAKPEIGIQFGAGGATRTEELEAQGMRDVSSALAFGRRCLDAGVGQIMIESEGITENVKTWRTEFPSRAIDALGLDRIMFEAADPEVFTWYVKTYGPDVNLFVDHSQIVQLECLRQGIWGTADVWGKVVTYSE